MAYKKPWPNELTKNIALWLQDNRDRDVDFKRSVVAGALEHLSREELLVYATNSFLSADALLTYSQQALPLYGESLKAGASAQGRVEQRQRKAIAEKSANARYDQPGGSRERKRQVIDAYYARAFSTKEEAYTALAAEFSISRKTVEKYLSRQSLADHNANPPSA